MNQSQKGVLDFDNIDEVISEHKKEIQDLSLQDKCHGLWL